MDTFGIPTSRRPRQFGNSAGLAIGHEFFRSIVLVILWVVPLAACSTVGVAPNIDHLEELSPGVSTAADILRLLGEPRGRGVARMTADFEPRDVWFYEQLQLKAEDQFLRMLLVFVKDGLYDGHLWYGAKLEGDLHWQWF